MAGHQKHSKTRSSTREAAAPVGRNRPRGSVGTWYRAKRPVVLFVLLFALLMGVFYAVTWIPAVGERMLPGYMRLNAAAAAAVMNAFGAEARTNDTQISAVNPRPFSVDIRQGCDAVEPTVLFVSAVLAFPAGLKFKVPGVLIGSLTLALINLIRIISLFYTGVYFPRAFEIMHVDVWQPIFILLSLAFWVFWAWWATKPRPSGADAA